MIEINLYLWRDHSHHAHVVKVHVGNVEGLVCNVEIFSGNQVRISVLNVFLTVDAVDLRDFIYPQIVRDEISAQVH